MQSEVEELGKALDSIFKDPKKTLEELTDQFGPLDYLAMNQEVKEMISTEEFQRLARQEGRQEGRQDGLVEAIRSCYQGLLASQKSDDEAINMTASLLRQKESDVRKIISEQLAI